MRLRLDRSTVYLLYHCIPIPVQQVYHSAVYLLSDLHDHCRNCGMRKRRRSGIFQLVAVFHLRIEPDNGDDGAEKLQTSHAAVV